MRGSWTMSHASHTTRYSDSSLYDEVCTKCGATDAIGDRRLNQPCPRAVEGGTVVVNNAKDELVERIVRAKREARSAKREAHMAGVNIEDIAAAVVEAMAVHYPVITRKHIGTAYDTIGA